jgi:hypothetical protein
LRFAELFSHCPGGICHYGIYFSCGPPIVFAARIAYDEILSSAIVFCGFNTPKSTASLRIGIALDCFVKFNRRIVKKRKGVIPPMKTQISIDHLKLDPKLIDQAGAQFAGWKGDIAILANPSLPTTTATIPSMAVTITATYTAPATNSPGTPN